MPTYVYIKAQSVPPSKFRKASKRTKARALRMLPNILIVLGATAVITVAYPLLSFQMSTITKGNVQQVIAPVDKSELDRVRNLAQVNRVGVLSDPAMPVQAYAESTAIEPIIVDIDYTKASNWFPEAAGVYNYAADDDDMAYKLSIPKLNVDKMDVEIGGEDLDKSLIQYAGTALPGQYGNPVIFGHSVLPLFNNPKNYMSVFTLLPTLDVNDEIFVDYDGIRYKYVIESYHEVQPDDIEVLEQRYDRQTITLITCVPPGTYLRRGVIQAHLVK